ncbi:esterase FE4 [Orussus abietinus]|uniref:esterase FE4 n=1 Tax=Orussus abietinus TaxID=222816 RepID=UPI000626BE08|nr:esterase FE4 [Orussus abietinus]
MWLVQVLLVWWSVQTTLATEEVLLDIPQGTLRGLRTKTNWHDVPYYSFKGIPYAKPNVGINKFQDPQPAEPWTGVHDATKHGSSCMSYCLIKQMVVGDEDCLFLNVYTPDLNKDAKRAVIVWIYGGVFTRGSADDLLYGPDFLVEHDVVLVTLNFRLGVLGFLNTGDKVAPGNAGLKDQVMALKWVRDNIVHFGGCAHRVTIAGQGAGGASVMYHLLSPMSEGLFKGAILQSGSAVNPWTLSHTPREDVFRLANALGIEATDSTELLSKLVEVPSTDIVLACQGLLDPKKTSNGKIFPFVPSVEPDVGQDVFLPDDPWQILKSGKIADVPLIGGMVLNEGKIFTSRLSRYTDYVNQHFEEFIPWPLNITDPARIKEVSESLRNFYLNGKDISTDNDNGFDQLVTDMGFTHGIIFPLKIISYRNTYPVYEYIFTFESPYNLMRTLFNVSGDTGATYGDELSFEFYTNIGMNIPEPGSVQDKMTNILTKLWTNFAKDGNPTSKLDDDVTVNWEPLGKEDNYLNINPKLEMEKDLWKDRIYFGANLYKDILGDYYTLFQ